MQAQAESREVSLFRKLLIVLLVLGLAGLIGFRLYQQLAPESAAAGGTGTGPAQRERPAFVVETAVVQLRQFDNTVEALGELKAQASVEVMSRISGRLEKVLVDRGDSVQKGQLVAVVEDTDLQQQIRRSEASIAVAKAAKRREEATVENARLQLERFQSLHEQALVSTQELQDLDSRARVAESQLELASAQVDQAEASLRELKLQQEQTRIFAPLDGVVGTRYLEPGALASPALPIVSILNLSQVKTVVPVPEGTLRSIRVGSPSRIVMDAFADKEYRGSVTRISPFLSPDTRSAEVEIEIPNPDRLLKPGMFARVQIDVKVAQQVLTIPRSALVVRGDQKGIFRLTPEMKAVYKQIEIGKIQNDYVEVISGLQPGMEIVTTGAQNLNEGDSVRVSSKNGP